MYNSPDMVVDEELTFLSYNQTVNKEFSVSDILSSDLWNVTVLKVDSLYKCIPLFNCDEIVSSNANDIVLDGNKCILLNENSDTLIECISSDTGGIHYHSLQLYAFAPYTVLDVVDEVTVYAILYDEYLNTLNDVEVNVLIDSEVVASVKTDNQGIARYKVNEESVVKFEYDETISNSIVIGNATPKTNTGVTLTSDKSTIYTDESVVFTGVLSDIDHNTPLSDATIGLYRGNVLVDTLTTDNTGSFSKTVTGLNTGTYSFKAVFDGDESYYSCQSDTVTIVVSVRPHEYNLSVTADKPILSYSDGEYSVITATLLDEDIPVSGEVVEFRINGSVVGTDTTDSSGEATYTYESTGAGDVTVTVSYEGLLEEIFVIEDCLKYDEGISDNTSDYDTTYSSGQSFSFDIDSYKLQRTNSGYGAILIDDLTVSNNVKISYLLKIDNSTSLNTQPALAFYNENGGGVGIRTGYNGSSRYFILSDVSYDNFGNQLARDDYSSLSQNTWYRVELSHNNGTMTAKLYDTSDNLLKTVTATVTKFSNNNNRVGIMCAYGSGVTMHFKELKVKAL